MTNDNRIGLGTDNIQDIKNNVIVDWVWLII